MKTLILSAIRCSLMFSAAAAFSLAYPVRANLITNGGSELRAFASRASASGFQRNSVREMLSKSSEKAKQFLFSWRDDRVKDFVSSDNVRK